MYFPHIVFHGADEDNFLNKTFTKVYLLIFSFFSLRTFILDWAVLQSL